MDGAEFLEAREFDGAVRGDPRLCAGMIGSRVRSAMSDNRYSVKYSAALPIHYVSNSFPNL